MVNDIVLSIIRLSTPAFRFPKSNIMYFVTNSTNANNIHINNEINKLMFSRDLTISFFHFR